VCHTKGSSNTYLPGGHVEFKEGAEDALVREIDEELGVTARVGRFLGAVEHTFKQKGKRHCEINLVFLMTLRGVSVRTDPPSKEGYIEFWWVPVNNLGAARLEPYPLCDLVPRWLRARPGSQRWSSTF
jgi:ADP-ribose pyrophosphatase YjhB (NUDIX family)